MKCEFSEFVDSDDKEYKVGEKEGEERQTMGWEREEAGNHSNSETQGIVCDGDCGGGDDSTECGRGTSDECMECKIVVLMKEML